MQQVSACHAAGMQGPRPKVKVSCNICCGEAGSTFLLLPCMMAFSCKLWQPATNSSAWAPDATQRPKVQQGTFDDDTRVKRQGNSKLRGSVRAESITHTFLVSSQQAAPSHGVVHASALGSDAIGPFVLVHCLPCVLRCVLTEHALAEQRCCRNP